MMTFYKYHDWISDSLLKEENYYIPSMMHLAINPSDIAIYIIDKHLEFYQPRSKSFNSILSHLCCNTNSNSINILETHVYRITESSWCLLNMMSSHEKALELCIKYNKIDWMFLSCNSTDSALALLCENQDKIYWPNLSMNRNDKAIKLLEENMEKIEWQNLCMNSNDKVYDLLIQNLDKIAWDLLAMNKSDKVLSLYDIDDNINKIDNEGWCWLSLNNSNKALDILVSHQDKIMWSNFAENDNDRAIELLRVNLDKIEVHHLFLNSNPKVMELIKEKGLYGCRNINRLFENPHIFTYNYEAIREHMKKTWLNDLLKFWHHPRNIHKWEQWGWDDCPDLENFGL